MTFEHKIIVGLDDINAVVFDCNKCHTRVSVAPENITIPSQCPKCGQIWIRENLENYQAVASPYTNFVNAIGKIRTLLENGAPFRILLQFDESEVA